MTAVRHSYLLRRTISLQPPVRWLGGNGHTRLCNTKDKGQVNEGDQGLGHHLIVWDLDSLTKTSPADVLEQFWTLRVIPSWHVLSMHSGSSPSFCHKRMWRYETSIFH
jgi:hypothetical protein